MPLKRLHKFGCYRKFFKPLKFLGLTLFFSAYASLFLSYSILAKESIPLQGSLRIASWNLEFLMDEKHFQAWAKACAPSGWAADKKIAPQLPYCDALDGLSYPDKRAQSLPLHELSAYLLKIKALQTMAKQHLMDIYAVQEVYDQSALEQVFPRESFVYFISHFPISQNLGFVVRKDLAPWVQMNVVKDLALNGLLKSEYSQHLRPGVALRMIIPSGSGSNKAVTLLNVHMKSGCKNYMLDQPTPKKGWEQKALQAIQLNCAIYRYQTLALKSWLIKHRHEGVVVLGDFNRDFFWEFEQMRHLEGSPRLKGSDSMSPLDPATEKTKLGLAFFEWNIFAQNPLIFARVKEKSAKSLRCLYGTDQIFWNKVFRETLDITMKKQAFSYELYRLESEKYDYPEENYGLDRALPSDHCMLSITVPLQLLN